MFLAFLVFLHYCVPLLLLFCAWVSRKCKFWNVLVQFSSRKIRFVSLFIHKLPSKPHNLFLWQGTIGFEAQIDKCLELSEYLYNKIKDREGYEMVFDGKVCPRLTFSLCKRHSSAAKSGYHQSTLLLLPQCIQCHYGWLDWHAVCSGFVLDECHFYL